MSQFIKSIRPLLQKSLLSNNYVQQKISVVYLTRFGGYNGIFKDQIRLCSTNNDKKGVEIYSGKLSPQIRSVKTFSLATSIIGIMGQPIIYVKTAELGSLATGALLGLVGFFTFATPLLLHFITKKYITTIHYDKNSETYTATTITMFLTKRETEFKTSDVVVPEVPGMFTSFLIKGKPLFVEPSQFSAPEHYIKIMGYDKPMDFKLNLDADEYKDSTKKEK